jgi:hypothetical protein
MKIAVINRSGNTGKSTFVRHGLAPRMPQAEVLAIESINADEMENGSQTILRGEDFGKLYTRLLEVDDAIVDIGSSNVESFVQLMSDYDGSYDVFDLYIVPCVPVGKQQKDTRKTIEDLRDFGVDASKVRLLFNRANKRTMLNEDFGAMYDYLRDSKAFRIVERAVLYESPAYGAASAAGKTVGELAASREEYKEMLATLTDKSKRMQCSQLMADAALAVGVHAQIERAVTALIG